MKRLVIVLVVVFGGLTIWFHNETFIKWKPSVLYWVMGLAFWASQAMWRKNLLQALIGDQLELPVRVWQRLNFAWIAFFAFMGLLNLYVAYSFSTDTWVSFKLFGGVGLAGPPGRVFFAILMTWFLVQALALVQATGLGLAFVREVAQLHGGTARLANHPEGGAVATLSIPRA